MSTFRSRLACSLASFLFVLGSAFSALGATPADEVLRLVPEDVGFCLVIRDLREHASALLQSPLAEHVRTSPQGTALAGSPEMAKLDEVEKFLQVHLGLDWARLRDDLLGDAVVFAYRPGPPGQADKEEQGLLLVRVRDAKLLADTLDRFNRAQKESGDLKELEPREHRGARYFRRVEKQQTQFYYLNGPIFAFTSQEEILQRAIDLDRTASTTGEPPIARQLRLLGADQRFAALWINPRAFLPELEWKAANAKAGEAAVLRAFATYWKALEGIALSLALDKDAHFSLAARVQPDQLPPAARRFFAEAAKPSELWGLFPDNALLSFAGRFDLPALAEMLSDFLPLEARQAAEDTLQRTFGAALGKDLLREVLPCVGPDIGFCITAPSAADKSWVPQSILAIRLRPGEKAPAVDQAVLSAVNSLALLAVLSHNKTNADQLSLKVEVDGKDEIKYLANEQRFPPGFRPAFALRSGYLVLASSPEAIRMFGSPKNRQAQNGGPVVGLSFVDMRRYLQERRQPVVAAAAEGHQITKEEAERRLDSVLQGTSILERLDVSQKAESGVFTLTVRVRAIKPLKK